MFLASQECSLLKDSFYRLVDRRSQGVGWQLRELVKGGTGVPPVNHEQDARATIKLTYYARIVELD
ncbi:MAG: hypothetical protein DMF71_09775 [Acidobacteria bacterium]|nr:MAG: hypothetical protein DMF71_09775 [Acidobacteriota bacterium]